MKSSSSVFAALVLCGGLSLFSGCGGAVDPAAEPAPLTAEQLAQHAREEADVQDAERQQQQLAKGKPAGKK